MDAVLLHRVFSSHTHNAWPFTGIAPNNGQPVCSRPTIRSLFCPRQLRRQRRRVCVCELLSWRNRAVAVYYIVFIYVFHPLIDTLRRRLRRTYVYYIQHCCQHLRRCSIAFYPTPSACFGNEPTYPLRIHYAVPFRSKGEVETVQFYPSSHFKTISKGHKKIPALIKQ